MEKYSEIIGLPVICASGGKNIGIVKDILFCPESKEVKALLLEQKGFRVKKRIILIKDVINMGRDAVMVEDSKCIVEMSKAEKTGELGKRGLVRGLNVFSREGNNIGAVEDIIFDSTTGHIEGLEITDGIFQDIINGRKIVPVIGRVEFGSENIILDKEAIEEIMETGGGIKKLLD